MRDTPQSCGLPRSKSTKMITRTTITKKRNRNDGEADLHAVRVAEQIAVVYRIANVFVYLLRYGILDWSPTS